ncbi:MAG: class I SAM-dependent methyltransferase [Steroidobacteraceae bacterium]
MTEPANDKLFAGAIPDIYERLLVPLMFEPFAAELAGRLKGMSCGELLELAAGTGVLTRRLAATLPAGVSITATDLNAPMLEMAQKRGTSRQVTWQVADAMALPFRDASFDAVLCQFGVMFLPDKPRAFAEMRRVLRPGGLLLFNVWTASRTTNSRR